jgi:2-oxoacid:acceptor oxidoreductase delta subunit (pyruvate/2-ketoisovalerate family)
MKQVNGRIQFETQEDLPLTAMSLKGTEWNKTGSWKFLSPAYQDMTPPCSNVCLTNMDVVGMMRSVEAGDWDAAARDVLDVNPFPAITGRVCPHPCEQPCNRKAFGGGISVRAVEQQVGDHKLAKDVRPPIPPAVHARVHVIGSGPAGLAAAVSLRRLGHPVTVHEAAPEPGGLLRYAVPEYRLPVQVVRDEIDWVRRLGVEFVTSSRRTREEIEALGPTIVSVGFGRSRELGIPGEDLPGVVDGLQVLAEIRRGEARRFGATAAVVGGGNTSMDVARSLLRLGTRPVVYYRRSAREMPAYREEVDAAKVEGVGFEVSAVPVRIEPSAGGRLLVTFARTEPGPADASGRAVPRAKAGTEFRVEVDLFVEALGQTVADRVGPDVASAACGRAHDVLEASTDCAERPGASVSEAIRGGRIAAHALHQELTGEAVAPVSPLADRGVDPEVAKFKALNLAYFRKEAPTPHEPLSLERRTSTFDPVDAGIGAEGAVREAARCFKCGTCVECDNCFHFCPDVAIQKKPGGGYVIDLAHCKGCGVCVEECPRAAIHLRKST